MRVVYKRCAGLDVHKKTVVACWVRINEENEWEQEVRTFGTMTCDLLDWLLAWEVTHVAMESTGEYWKPVYNLLESQLKILLVNAKHCKECAWPQDRCQRCGMVGRTVGARLVESEFHSSQAAT